MPMKMRATYLQDQTSLSDTDSPRTDLDVKKPISAIDVIIRAKNGSTRNDTVGLHTDVDAINILDGGDEIVALDGSQHLGASFYRNMNNPPVFLTEAASGIQRMMVRIPFGRWLGDPLYYLDPGMFKNLQLELEVSLTISSTAGFVTDTGDYSVIAHIMEEGAKPREGTLRMREHKEFTSVASGDDKTELDTDEVLRRLFVRSRESIIDFETDITTLKLRADKKEILIDSLRVVDWFDLIKAKYGQCVLTKTLDAKDNSTRLIPIQKIEEITMTPAIDKHAAIVDALVGERMTISLFDLATPSAITTEEAIRVVARGVAPYATLAYDFGWPQDPEEWYDPSALGSLDAILTQGGAGATVQVFTESVLK